MQNTPDEWYAFHFGRSFARSPDFDSDRLFGGSFKDCTVLFADFCSFTSFTRATENTRIMESLLTSFYT
jgi:UDP-galactopyranose mutase